MHELSNDGGDCRTAPATPGLLNFLDYEKLLESLLTVGFSNNFRGVGWVSKSTTRTEPSNYWSYYQMLFD